LGWQIGVTIGAFVSGTILQGLVILSYPTYNPQRWHGTLMAIMVTFITAGFNMFLANWFPFVEGIILFLHFAGWLAMLIPLWVLAPKDTNAQVWNSFLDSGWRNSEYPAWTRTMRRLILRLRSWCGLSYRDDN
jgi:choline transport protein